MLKINRPRTFLPLSISRGTVEERLENAKLLNLKFYKNMAYDFKNREIKPATIKRDLKETAGGKINIQTNPDDINPNWKMSSSYWGLTSKISGFSFIFPVNYNSKMFEQRNVPQLLTFTQNFFNNIFNPKFLTRKVAMTNKKQNLAGTEKFFTNNVSGTSTHLGLSEKLDKLLLDKNYSEKINTLQSLRYDLISEKNTKSAQYQIDKQIEKTEHLQFVDRDYDMNKYNYDEKLQILNEKLAVVLQKTREAIAETRPSKTTQTSKV